MNLKSESYLFEYHHRDRINRINKEYFLHQYKNPSPRILTQLRQVWNGLQRIRTIRIEVSFQMQEIPRPQADIY